MQIQEKWCVCCKVTKVENDRLVPMFWCVCISKSDQSPSTKRCKKQDCRNQVVQFLTNPFLANFQNGHSPPLHIGMERLVVTQKGGPHVPPSMGRHMGLYMVKVTNPREVVGWLHVTKVEE